MVRSEVIRKRLNQLDEYLSILRRMQGYASAAASFCLQAVVFPAAYRFFRPAGCRFQHAEELFPQHH
jgi:hypothetical protein